MVGCFKYVQKYKRLIKKTLERMTQYLLNESADLGAFYSAEGELQNYLQRKIKKIHNTGKFLTKETNSRVKELLELNSELIKKLSKISERENKGWNLSSEIRNRGLTANIYMTPNRGNQEGGRDTVIDDGYKSKAYESNYVRTTTSDSGEDRSLKKFLVHTINDSSSGVQKIVAKLEKCYAQLISIFVVFPKIIKNLQGLFEDKKEKSQYFDVTQKRRSKRLFFWKNSYNQKKSFSYIQNIFQKLLGSFSKALRYARKVIFKSEGSEDVRVVRDTLGLDQSLKQSIKNNSIVNSSK